MSKTFDNVDDLFEHSAQQQASTLLEGMIKLNNDDNKNILYSSNNAANQVRNHTAIPM